MNCLYCNKEIKEDWLFCGYCGTNIKEYQKAKEHINNAIELEKNFEFIKAIEECEKALKLNIPHSEINEVLTRIRKKEEKIIEGMEKGAELLSQKKWKKALYIYKKILEINPKIEDEIAPKIVKAKEMILLSNRRQGIIALGIIIIVGIVIFLLWRYTRTPTQIAKKTIIQSVLSKELETKIAAIEALGALKDKKFIPLINENLKHKNPIVRATAVKALGEIKDSTSIPLIKERLFDENWRVRIEAAKALAKLGDSSGIEIIEEELRY